MSLEEKKKLPVLKTIVFEERKVQLEDLYKSEPFEDET